METLKVGDTVELRRSAEFTRGTVVKLIGNAKAAVRWQTRVAHEGKTTTERIADLGRVSG